jgi:type I restriction enzyme M protein
MTTRITTAQLEKYLWGAADLLRGSIDAGEYKSYIFPLLFLKRLSDVYDEETSKALSESSGDEAYSSSPEQHRFVVTKKSHWSKLVSAPKDIGSAIQEAMRDVERTNPRLEGIFGDASWTNKSRLRDSTLKNLLSHFSMLTLSLKTVPEDEMGIAYEYLIKKFADDSGHTAAEFYTNRTVVHLMTKMLDIQSGESVYDPTCGTGGMLMSAVEELRKQGKEFRNLTLYGQEINLGTSAIARMNLYLHGIEDFSAVRGDTLANPAFIDGDELRKFDVVLANPPYSIKAWDRVAWVNDPWGRNKYGTPPQGRADYAFWQHILASLKPDTGRCAILFPHGVLFRDEEFEMRKKMIEDDVIEAVLGLGPNLFYNSPMEACVVFCRSKKHKSHQGKILFINALDEVSRQSAQSFLTDSNINRIDECYKKFESEEDFAWVASNEQIAQNNYSLSIPLYVRSRTSRTIVNTPEAASSWSTSSNMLHHEIKQLESILAERGRE